MEPVDQRSILQMHPGHLASATDIERLPSPLEPLSSTELTELLLESMETTPSELTASPAMMPSRTSSFHILSVTSACESSHRQLQDKVDTSTRTVSEHTADINSATKARHRMITGMQTANNTAESAMRQVNAVELTLARNQKSPHVITPLVLPNHPCRSRSSANIR
jgi:hypothetical protein